MENNLDKMELALSANFDNPVLWIILFGWLLSGVLVGLLIGIVSKK